MKLWGSWIVQSLAAVDRIANQRMAQRVHVHANLMGSTGSKAAFEQGGAGETFYHLETRQGRTPGRHHGHARAMSRIAPDGRAHLSVQFDHPVNDGKVVAPHRSGLELPNQLGMCSQSFCHHEKSARVLVEPVHDTRPGDLR